MSSKCLCQVCGRPVDCGDSMCGICDCSPACVDGVNCERIVREVKPGLFVVQLDNGHYTLKWIPKSTVLN